MLRKILALTLFSLLIFGCEPLPRMNEQDDPADIEPSRVIRKESDGVFIAGFNVQVLGKTKMNKQIAETYLPAIIKQFDIVAIQELRDSSGEAIEELHSYLPNYEMILSKRLGRTTSKEQYVVFYKEGEVLNERVYPDVEDDFEREPYIVFMEVNEEQFSLIIIHVKPSDAEAEIVALQKVINYTQKEYNDTDFILLGDLNADCGYYDESQDNLRQYEWVIDNDLDTTIGSTVCTYDRIITNMGWVQGGIYDYKTNFGLTQDEAEIISDHYPVVVEV